MDLSEWHRKLIETARAHPPGDQVPYAFEKRVMARLTLRSGVDPVALWAQSLWRCAGVCVVVVLLFGALTAVFPPRHSSTDLAQDFEKTMLSAVDQDGDSTW